ncbi:MAG TPA: hypothetical protein VFA27_03535 [Vicinamibacterales bacterium]|nr:hypothetical protein [Vicinamibacterales bacterium]
MRVGFVLALALAFVAAPPAGSDIDPLVRGVLTGEWHFSNDELADLERGKVVKHSLEAPAAGEMAVVGAIRVNAPKQRFLDLARDITRFKRSEDVVAIGRFSDPPTLQDLASLTIDKDDFDPSSCRLHDCDVRLPARVIERVRHEPDPIADFKHVIFENVVAYEKGETQGRLLEYDDGDKPIRPVDEFEGLLRDTPALGALVPELPDHFRKYPFDPIAADDDFLYWSKEKFGIAPFITVTHVTTVCPSARTCVMATRDVYSSRYIDASLSITVATDTGGPPEGFYLVFANRSRASALKGGFAGLRRALAGRRARGSLEENLKRAKARIESGLAPR